MVRHLRISESLSSDDGFICDIYFADLSYSEKNKLGQILLLEYIRDYINGKYIICCM